MTRHPLARLGLAALATALMAGAAVVARQAPPAAPPMAAAARQFLASLDPAQEKIAHFQFDSPERQQWYFTPRQLRREPTRHGLRLDKMTPAQKTLAMNLLRSGLSARGFDQAGTIMSLENVLKEIERNGANTRNPEWYFVSVFGEPTATGDWAWRVEGHHLSVNLTLSGGRVAGATPVLFAANPAEVRQGPRKGLRTLPGTTDKAEELIKSLTTAQDRKARQEKPFPEVQEGLSNSGIGDPVGVTLGELTAPQAEALSQLIDVYLNRLAPEGGGRGARARPRRRQGQGPLRLQPRGDQAGQAADLPRPGADVRGGVLERAGRQRGQPGEPHPQRVAAAAEGFRVEVTHESAAGFSCPLSPLTPPRVSGLG